MRLLICLITYLSINQSLSWLFKSTVMQIEKPMINHRLYVSKGSRKIRIPTIYSFAVIYRGNLLVSSKITNFLTAPIIFSVYKQNVTAQ